MLKQQFLPGVLHRSCTISFIKRHSQDAATGSNADLELLLQYLCTLLPFSAITASFRKIQYKVRCDSSEAVAGITNVYNHHILKGVGFSTESG